MPIAGGGRGVEPHGAAVEKAGIDVAEHEVGVGDGRLGPTARRSRSARIGAGAFRSDLDQPHLVCGDAAAAGADLQQLDGQAR